MNQTPKRTPRRQIQRVPPQSRPRVPLQPKNGPATEPAVRHEVNAHYYYFLPTTLSAADRKLLCEQVTAGVVNFKKFQLKKNSSRNYRDFTTAGVTKYWETVNLARNSNPGGVALPTYRVNKNPTQARGRAQVNTTYYLVVGPQTKSFHRNLTQQVISGQGTRKGLFNEPGASFYGFNRTGGRAAIKVVTVGGPVPSGKVEKKTTKKVKKPLKKD